MPFVLIYVFWKNALMGYNIAVFLFSVMLYLFFLADVTDRRKLRFSCFIGKIPELRSSTGHGFRQNGATDLYGMRLKCVSIRYVRIIPVRKRAD